MDPTRMIAWDVYFASVTSLTFHPGSTRDGRVPPTVKECAAVADQMLAERDRRFGPEAL